MGGYRPMGMRLVMPTMPGLLLTLALLAGCGEGPEGDAAADGSGLSSPSASSASTPASTPAHGPVDFTEVAVVADPDAGGRVDERAVDLTDEAAFAEFVAQFDGSRMEDKLRAEIESADVPEGQVLAGAVVAIGCLPPSGLVAEYTDRGLMVAGIPDKREATVDCFAAVTSVAVVAVDASLV